VYSHGWTFLWHCLHPYPLERTTSTAAAGSLHNDKCYNRAGDLQLLFGSLGVEQLPLLGLDLVLVLDLNTDWQNSIYCRAPQAQDSPTRLRIKLPRQDIIHLSHFPVALFHPPCGCVCSTGISSFPSFPHFHLLPRRQDFMMSILAFRRWLLKIENHNRINFLHRKLSPLSAKSWISLWLSPIPESRHCTMSEC